jgi:hypothetical protein
MIFKLYLSSVEKSTRQRNSLPTLDKELLYRVFSFTELFLLVIQQRVYLPSARKKHLTKHLALGKKVNSVVSLC